ncbi:hypothetical protein [Streptomyces sp. NPDC057677]
MTRPAVDILSPLLTTPTVPAWITDPNLRADILAGFAEIPDDVRGAQ